MIQFLKKGRLSRDFILTFCARVGVTGAGALAGVVVARLLGATEFGRFSFAYSLIFLALLPVKFGLDGAAVRFVAHYVSIKNYPSLHGFLVSSRRSMWLAAAGAFVLVVGAGIVWLREDMQQLMLLLAALPTFVFLAQVHFDQQVLNGLHKTAYAPIPEGGIRAGLLVVFIVVSYLAFDEVLSAELALLLNGAALLCALVVSRTVVKAFTEKYKTGRPLDMSERNRWMKTGYAHLVISCSHVILSQTDVCMLGIMSGSRSVGIYAVALQLSTFLLFFANAINPVITPRMSSAYSQQDMKGVFQYARMGTNLAFGLTFPIFLGFYFFRAELLHVLFGAEYRAAVQVVGLLLVAQLAKVISSPIGFVFTMTDREEIASRVIGGAALLNIVLNVFFIPRYGVVGAALATAISAATWNVVLILYAYRNYGVLLLPGLSSDLPERTQ